MTTFKQDFDRAVGAPWHPEVGVDAAVDRLLEIERGTAESRRLELEEELRAWGLIIRDDSTFCAAYLNGTTLRTAKEVAAVLSVASWLFKYGGDVYARVHGSAERKLRENAYKRGMSWKASLENVMKDGTYKRMISSSLRSAHYQSHYYGFSARRFQTHYGQYDDYGEDVNQYDY